MLPRSANAARLVPQLHGLLSLISAVTLWCSRHSFFAQKQHAGLPIAPASRLCSTDAGLHHPHSWFLLILQLCLLRTGLRLIWPHA